MDFAKKFDVIVEKRIPVQKAKTASDAGLPITFAKHPDITALAGIWKDRDIF